MTDEEVELPASILYSVQLRTGPPMICVDVRAPDEILLQRTIDGTSPNSEWVHFSGDPENGSGAASYKRSDLLGMVVTLSQQEIIAYLTMEQDEEEEPAKPKGMKGVK